MYTSMKCTCSGCFRLLPSMTTHQMQSSSILVRFPTETPVKAATECGVFVWVFLTSCLGQEMQSRGKGHAAHGQGLQGKAQLLEPQLGLFPFLGWTIRHDCTSRHNSSLKQVFCVDCTELMLAISFGGTQSAEFQRETHDKHLAD